MNRLFRWGTLIALFILIATGFIAFKMIFIEGDGIDVPPVVGLASSDAAAILANAGLMSRVDMVESDQPAGTVVSQTPSFGGKISKGGAVVIRVSKGGALANIPDTRGMEFADAARALSGAGFKVGTVLRVSDASRPAGSVIAQNPAAPAMVPSDRMVDLLVSEGASGKNEMIQVPDLRGQSEEIARTILTQSSLSVSRTITVDSNLVPDGTVLRTQPIAGSRVPGGNAIVLYLARAAADAPSVSEPVISQTPPNAPAAEVSASPPSQPTQPSTPPAVPQTVTAQQPSAPVQTPAQQTTATTPAPPQEVVRNTASRPAETAPAATPSKTAKIRYQVPPLTRPLRFRVTINDDLGMRVLREQQVRGGEYVAMDIGYTGTAKVDVIMENETVWQESFR